jgi:hypothetical protein
MALAEFSAAGGRCARVYLYSMLTNLEHPQARIQRRVLVSAHAPPMFRH